MLLWLPQKLGLECRYRNPVSTSGLAKPRASANEETGFLAILNRYSRPAVKSDFSDPAPSSLANIAIAIFCVSLRLEKVY
jgi:hypothetical protein